MSIGIKVAIRCRPFTIDDALGVKLIQNEEESGEVELINCDYSTKRFPFTYCWWSAYGFKRHLTGNNMPDAEDMKLINQEMAYEDVGKKIKGDVLTGNAVVLFAYGLSGSGKTYTVFGPDAVDAPEAWFKHAEPQPLWGIFPRLAYELFQEKQDGWKISMKYFQNVVDTVRDLMSPNADEQHYKNGMRKDPDGFMDIEWCDTKKLSSWEDLRTTFQLANARKAIAPTQFNPMSTRGHCIMMLEVEMPHPEREGTKQRGRIYVCDLAGTEPAGDIVYAQYKKVTFEDGSFEYKFEGAHPDKNKSKELQDQGKKINLSLSEMAQFFMKMAEAVMKKKLKPGATIAGCNSFFLCKYLKDTMLQAKTYLFCAIRPEVTYLKYTFATLGFAKNASVVRLAPKKATTAASPAERKLMAELDAMKELVAQLQANAAAAPAASAAGPDEDSARMIAELQAKLANKQTDLENLDDGDANNARAEQQREEYARRGISLVAYEAENKDPYFSNLDADAFRSNRFMYILRKELTVFGSKGDIKLMSLAVLKEHCSVRFDGTDATLIGGKGETFHNGKHIDAGQEVKLAVFDRVAVGDQLMMFHWPGKEDGAGEPMNADDAVEEFQEGMIASRNSGGGGGGEGLEEERMKILKEREQWEKEKEGKQAERDEQAYQRAMAAVDNSILDLLPKTKEAKQTVDLLNRVTMTFDVVLEKGIDNVPRVKVHVENSQPKLSILVDPQEFLPKLSLLKDEMMKLRSAIDAGREYELPEQHDPIYLMFDNDFHLGTATHWPEYLLYNLETEEEERMQEIKNAAVPYNNVGLLEVRWTPLAGPDEADEGKPVPDIESEEELIGKPWTYQLEIKRSANLPLFCSMAYVSYDFFGEACTTEAVQELTFSPTFDYKKIHHVPNVTPEFIAFLKGSVEMQIHVTQNIDPPKDKISTANTIVVDSIKSGEALGYQNLENPGATRPKSDAEIRCESLTQALEKASEENVALKSRVQELEARVAELESNAASGAKKSLEAAKLIDQVVNGDADAPAEAPAEAPAAAETPAPAAE
mmetsp:Transcript_8034/g.13361  ORF Transcript_8034/g.13361 Transcript_8034/m.13361 type:complete len:1045 (-) Transcript_8034:212-3346(-)